MFDTKGRMISQSISGTPGHINAMATSMKHFLAAFPPDISDGVPNGGNFPLTLTAPRICPPKSSAKSTVAAGADGEMTIGVPRSTRQVSVDAAGHTGPPYTSSTQSGTTCTVRVVNVRAKYVPNGTFVNAYVPSNSDVVVDATRLVDAL